MKKIIYVYGAPASGKTTFAKRFASAADARAVDLDACIEETAGRDIPSIFAEEGEEAFRELESSVLRRVSDEASRRAGTTVVSLGGGALLRGANRDFAESAGDVICLDTPGEKELARRLSAVGAAARPLGNKAKERAEHYASFPRRIAAFFDLPGSLVAVGRSIAGTFLEGGKVVADANVAAVWRGLVPAPVAVVPSGEEHKTPHTVASLWSAFAAAGISRRDVVSAVGGGVTGDLAGFAAATWMRGIDWMNFPTTLLSMVDASTGGKTGCDLPEGKNLAGAFHSPRLVAIDADFLSTLDAGTLAQGRAEMIKHEIIGGLDAVTGAACLEPAGIAANLKVKIDIVREDPFEKTGRRALLNCGHTVAHAIEKITRYGVSHGEAVAAGCVEEARLAEREGLASKGWADSLAERFAAENLPVSLPAGVAFDDLVPLMAGDKKRDGSAVSFALPCAWGDVRLVKFDLSGGRCRIVREG